MSIEKENSMLPPILDLKETAEYLGIKVQFKVEFSAKILKRSICEGTGHFLDEIPERADYYRQRATVFGIKR